MINRMMNTPCAVIRRVDTGEVDRVGDPILEVERTETRCALHPVRRGEHEDGGAETSDTTWRLFLPFGTAIDTGDAIEVEGHIYELTGQPWDAREGVRSLWHVEATVRRTSGPQWLEAGS